MWHTFAHFWNNTYYGLVLKRTGDNVRKQTDISFTKWECHSVSQAVIVEAFPFLTNQSGQLIIWVFTDFTWEIGLVTIGNVKTFWRGTLRQMSGLSSQSRFNWTETVPRRPSEAEQLAPEVGSRQHQTDQGQVPEGAPLPFLWIWKQTYGSSPWPDVNIWR